MSKCFYPAAFILAFGVTLQLPQVVAQTATTAEAEAKAKRTTGQQQGHRRGPKTFTLANSEGATIRLWKPDLTVIPLTATHGSITMPRTGVDNYHSVVVEQDWGYLKEALIRYVYFRGKPSGHSTSELTEAVKTTFEIVPDPVPREHQHYRSDQHWSFLLRFRGMPASNLPVVLKSSNGTSLSSVSGSNGSVSFLIPDDFPQLEQNGRDKRTAEFSIQAETVADGITYQTQLSADYRVNPSHWQSLGLGIFVTGIGVLAGGFLGRKVGRSS